MMNGHQWSCGIINQWRHSSVPSSGRWRCRNSIRPMTLMVRQCRMIRTRLIIYSAFYARPSCRTWQNSLMVLKGGHQREAGWQEGGREGGEWISQQLHGLSPVIIWPICYDDSTGKHQTFSGLLNLSATNAALCSNQYAGGVAVNNSELTAAAGSWNIHRSPFTGGQTDLWPIR